MPNQICLNTIYKLRIFRNQIVLLPEPNSNILSSSFINFLINFMESESTKDQKDLILDILYLLFYSQYISNSNV